MAVLRRASNVFSRSKSLRALARLKTRLAGDTPAARKPLGISRAKFASSALEKNTLRDTLRGRKEKDETAKPRRGRPPLDPRNLRDCRLTVRFTEAELEYVTAKAARAHLEPAPFVRLVAIGTTVSPPRVPEINFQAIADMNRLGNNLNQLVKLIHSRRAPSGLAPAIEELLEHFDRIETLLLGQLPRGGAR